MSTFFSHKKIHSFPICNPSSVPAGQEWDATTPESHVGMCWKRAVQGDISIAPMEMHNLHSKIPQFILIKYKAKSQEAAARLCVLNILKVITVQKL